MLEDYKKLGTKCNLQDLIDLGVKPKDSSTHLALISFKRLVALRDKVLSELDENMVGTWIPAIKPEIKEIPNGEITDPKEIIKYGKPGMTILATSDYQNGAINGLKGIIKDYYENSGDPKFGIEFNSHFEGAHDLRGSLKENKGFFVPPNNLKILVPEKKIKEAYNLAKDVVADEKLGHKIRFKKGYKGEAKDKNNYNISVEIPSEATALLKDYKDNFLDIVLDNPIADNRKIVKIRLEQLVENIEASSLGQIEPQNKEKMVLEEVLNEFFPRTRLDTLRAYRAVIGIIIGKDMNFYGPPGSGKSQITKDIVEIAKQQEVIFIVDECKVQCNPFSLVDPKFAKIVPPCPECMTKYSPGFKETGWFTPPKPKDVKVLVARYSQGRGIESIEGTVGLTLMDLAGIKLPKFDGTSDDDAEDEASPKGFHPGLLLRSNNGILRIEEMDKIRPPTLDGLLEALNSNKIKPDRLRFEYPCNSNIIATSNDPSVFSGPLRDRMFFLAIRYPEDPETNYEIIRAAYHGEITPAKNIPIGDTHRENGNSALKDIPMPVILEKAVVSSYMKFINEAQNLPGYDVIQGSNRCRQDALDVARAKLVVDQLFFKDKPKIPNAEYAIAGMQFALCARVAEVQKEADQNAKTQLNGWVSKTFPEILKQEESTWWCNAYKHIAIAKTQASEIENNFLQELDSYKQDPRNAISSYQSIKAAREDLKNLKKQKAIIEYPFMDYLFNEQPKMHKANDDQLVELVRYFTSCQEGAACKI
jgi:hypothetical protein